MTTSRPAEYVNGILTSWIPLTTTGPTFSQTCSSAIYMPPGQEILAGFDPWYGQHINTAQACLAKEQTTWWDQLNAPSTTYLLGPFACPTEYTQVATQSIDATSTLIACCPSGYQYRGTIYSAPTPSQCVSIATSGQVVTYIGDSSGTWAQNKTTFGPSGGTIIGGQLNGYIFNDVVTTASSSNATAAVSTTASSNTIAQQTSSSTSASATGNANSGSSGLSSGTKIGVGVGVGLGAIGIAALIAGFLLYRRSKAKKNNVIPEAEAYEANHFLDTPRPDGPSTPSASGSEIKKENFPPQQMTEMYTPHYASEVHGETQRAEMPA